MPRKNLAARMGGWSAHHRWLALGLWFAFVIAAIVGGAITGQVNLKESQLGDGEAGHAARVIDDAGFKDRAGEMIIITDPGHTVDDPSFRAVVNQAVDRVSTFPQVTNVRSPLASSNSGQVTKDGRSVLVQFDITGPIDTAKDRIQPVMNAAADLQKAHPEMHIAEFGQASADHVLSNKIDGDLNDARNVSPPLTLTILLFAFGAAVAAGIPVLLAFSAVLATFGLNSMISHRFPTTDVTAEIILMIGMAVGVGYPLFYLRRERDERAVTKTADKSRIKAAKTGLRLAKKNGDAAVIASAKGTLREAKRASAANCRVGPRPGRLHVGPGRAHFRRHRLHGDVRDAARRRPHVRRHRHRRDARRGSRRRRLADRPPRNARAARGQGRAPHPADDSTCGADELDPAAALPRGHPAGEPRVRRAHPVPAGQTRNERPSDRCRLATHPGIGTRPRRGRPQLGDRLVVGSADRAATRYLHKHSGPARSRAALQSKIRRFNAACSLSLDLRCTATHVKNGVRGSVAMTDAVPGKTCAFSLPGAATCRKRGRDTRR